MFWSFKGLYQALLKPFIVKNIYIHVYDDIFWDTKEHFF